MKSSGRGPSPLRSVINWLDAARLRLLERDVRVALEREELQSSIHVPAPGIDNGGPGLIGGGRFVKSGVLALLNEIARRGENEDGNDQTFHQRRMDLSNTAALVNALERVPSAT